MAVKVSSSGLSFIKSWSLFSETPFNVLQRNLPNILIGYYYSGLEIPYRPYNTIEKTDSVSESDASSVFEQELTPASFKLFKDFGFEFLSQQQFDTLLSICTTYRTSDYYDRLKESAVFSAVKSGADPSVVANLIVTDLPVSPEVQADPKKFGVFYDLTLRRQHEADLYLTGVYNPCPGLTPSVDIVDDIKIFY